MISRRTVIAGLTALMAPALAGCARRPLLSPSSGANVPASAPMSAPLASGLDGRGLDAVIDLSHSSTVTDFALMRNRSNILGVLHKASEGGDWLDPLYRDRQAQAEAAGLLWGAYHFGTRQYSGGRQAASFLAAVRPGPATLMALDLEPNERNPANSMDLGRAEEFVRAIYQATGRLPLIYTHPTWADGRPYGRARTTLGGAVGSQSILAACDLWLADYRMEPELPWAWAGRGWRLWQYAGDDHRGGGGPNGSLARAVAGVDRCDRNLFVGDAAQLYRFWTGAGGTV